MGLSSAFAEDVMVYYSDVLKLMCLDAESQSSNSVLNKLANFIGLYVLSEDYARFGFLPFSQQELASAIGASRVQVARVCEMCIRDSCPATDIYSCGAVFFHLLSGRRLREGEAASGGFRRGLAGLPCLAGVPQSAASKARCV